MTDWERYIHNTHSSYLVTKPSWKFTSVVVSNSDLVYVADTSQRYLNVAEQLLQRLSYSMSHKNNTLKHIVLTSANLQSIQRMTELAWPLTYLSYLFIYLLIYLFIYLCISLRQTEARDTVTQTVIYTTIQKFENIRNTKLSQQI